MITVTTWTGWEATALRTAMRMSAADFAEHLGVGHRTVVSWGARGRAVKLRAEMRLMTHALMSNGDMARAVNFAQTAAARLQETTRLVDADSVAVYGALLLRTAIAVARHDDRAYRIAPEEIRSRPATHRIVEDLAARARGHLRRRVNDFATTAGVLL